VSTTVYGPSTVKRHRSSRAELQTVDAAIVEAVETEHPEAAADFRSGTEAADLSETETAAVYVAHVLCPRITTMILLPPPMAPRPPIRRWMPRKNLCKTTILVPSDLLLFTPT
jgi:hypothetical protein